MIRENRDAAFWGRVANHPSVRPSLGGEGRLDFSAVVTSDDFVPLATPHGGFIFVRIWPTRWELHTLFLREGRGRSVLAAFGEAARHMFTATDCVEIVTKAADSNRAAQFMASRAGFRAAFRRDSAWKDGSGLSFYALTLDEWAAKSEHTLAAGRRFHATLEEAKRAAGSTLAVHEDDDAHDRFAGAAALMLEAGQAARAVSFYNRWAVLAGYHDIELHSEDPPVVDARDAIVGVRDGKLEVLQCR